MGFSFRRNICFSCNMLKNNNSVIRKFERKEKSWHYVRKGLYLLYILSNYIYYLMYLF